MEVTQVLLRLAGVRTLHTEARALGVLCPAPQHPIQKPLESDVRSCPTAAAPPRVRDGVSSQMSVGVWLPGLAVTCDPS